MHMPCPTWHAPLVPAVSPACSCDLLTPFSHPCRAARIDFVSLANNHCLDFKQAGLAETQHALAAAGIAYAGVGWPAQAASPVILERAGLRLAFFSYSGAMDRPAVLCG